MDTRDSFVDLDDEGNYQGCLSKVKDGTTRNFVVDFGKYEAKAAFDINAEALHSLLDSERAPTRPVRWINLWAPDKQVDILDLIGTHYQFSPRLLAIMRTSPPNAPSQVQKRPIKQTRPRYQHMDLENGAASLDIPRKNMARRTMKNEISHYTIAKQMIFFNSVDVGPNFLCIGANWMHDLPPLEDSTNSTSRRLWSWFVLCSDGTVISMHEDSGPIDIDAHLRAIRRNTISVFSQLSNYGHFNADAISLQAIRPTLASEPANATETGNEGASNLFYYLFDDWQSTYSTTAMHSQTLESLEKSILNDMYRGSNSTPNIGLIPRLHNLGRQIRQMQHLYEGYRNLILRILERKSVDRSASAQGGTEVFLASSASQRFERLGDRIKLLILSELQEFLSEKDALVSMYFNITAQKDSEATARLTRAATLLAKLSVLFLPVSLMTSYFSVQIDDLAGVYTSKDYWYTFAVIMSISFLCLFFFSRLLMWCTDVLDIVSKKMTLWVAEYAKRLKPHNKEENHREEYEEKEE